MSERAKIFHGNCLEVMAGLPDSSVDAVVTDPPYGIDFLGHGWDSSVDFVTKSERWAREALRVLKPGGHLLAFAGARTYHRMACGVELAGFEIRDQIVWLYGEGAPKARDLTVSIDRMRTGEDMAPIRRWTAWFRDTCEKIDVAAATVDALVGRHGMAGHWRTQGMQPEIPSPAHWVIVRAYLVELGAVIPAWVDDLVETRAPQAMAIATREVVGKHSKAAPADTMRANLAREPEHEPGVKRGAPVSDAAKKWVGWSSQLKPGHESIVVAQKPFPGSLARNVLDWGVGALNIDDCRIEAGPDYYAKCASVVGLSSGHGYSDLGGKPRGDSSHPGGRWPSNVAMDESVMPGAPERRFFYCPKASRKERDGSGHPTVKPLALMQWLVRLVTPVDGLVLDPFLGSGTTAVAAVLEGFRVIGIEQESEWVADATRRVTRAMEESLI